MAALRRLSAEVARLLYFAAVRPCRGLNSRAVQGSDLAGALGGIRTPNLLIRSQMLYPLSYERYV
jgi:hypothetical protein